MNNRRAWTREEIEKVHDKDELERMLLTAQDAVEGIETLLDFNPDHPRRDAATTALIHWRRAVRDLTAKLKKAAA
ncbi:MAG: hypothetical protein KGL39_50480 [Patescibacteria group bacterium]|nr:hypothetical protein [Patescibacteria group bacterium]